MLFHCSSYAAMSSVKNTTVRVFRHSFRYRFVLVKMVIFRLRTIYKSQTYVSKEEASNTEEQMAFQGGNFNNHIIGNLNPICSKSYIFITIRRTLKKKLFACNILLLHKVKTQRIPTIELTKWIASVLPAWYAITPLFFSVNLPWKRSQLYNETPEGYTAGLFLTHV